MSRARWGAKYPHCVNCGSTAHRPRGRGFCTRCWTYQEFLEQIVAGKVETGEYGPNGWGSGVAWRSELCDACKVHLSSLRSIEEMVRGEVEVSAWDLHVKIEEFQRALHFRPARLTSTVHIDLPDAEARRVIYTWLVDWLHAHRRGEKIDDLYLRAQDRVRYAHMEQIGNEAKRQAEV